MYETILFEKSGGVANVALNRPKKFCGYTQDHREGVAAFFEKREARFTGR